MEQEKTVEQKEQKDVFIPYSNRTFSQPITLGGPSYLPPASSRAFIPTTRPLSNRENRRLIFEYLKQIWSLDTDALTIAKDKQALGSRISLKEQEFLKRHEDKSQTQDRSNKSPSKRQRRC